MPHDDIQRLNGIERYRLVASLQRLLKRVEVLNQGLAALEVLQLVRRNEFFEGSDLVLRLQVLADCMAPYF